jgi:hypothetical protein
MSHDLGYREAGEDHGLNILRANQVKQQKKHMMTNLPS